ncbi:conserved membrane hypothetical protein [Flavobacterium sp. 9AF]|uniref:hypothetical protein n=1 Tax=Flavobacterium sp. 9AF TaxID=2653142 RepID=UPI0012F2FD90|nr:hypothetical protein [Flavobacterium sp. 9AF]VXC15410.1 conserved membrane hypothetical protein [Flavobacterium sp. 9AF]
MDASNYLATTYWVIGVNIIFMFATLWLLKIGRATKTTKWVFGLISIAWIIFIHFVFSNKLIIPIDISGGAFYALTLSSATLVLVVFYFSPLKKVFDNISQENIQIVQGLRVLVASGFLMEGVLQVIPAWFSIMDGFLHVSSGFLALLASIAVVKNQTSKNQLLWLANIVGALDIVIIVTSISLVVWKDLGAFHNMQYVVFYTGILLLWFHFVSISKLIKSTK